jgi:hypothetical protein
VTTIEVEKAFGTRITAGQSVTIREYAPLALPLREGETVLWFLKKTNAAGFDSPVGDVAGDFRVLPDPNHPKKRLALSMVSNRGLWSKETSFWKSFDPMFVKSVGSELKKSWPTSAADIAAAVDRPCSTQPIPLEILLAAAASRFHSGLKTP